MKSLVFRKATNRSGDLNHLSQNNKIVETIGCIMQIHYYAILGFMLTMQIVQIRVNSANIENIANSLNSAGSKFCVYISALPPTR